MTRLQHGLALLLTFLSLATPVEAAPAGTAGSHWPTPGEASHYSRYTQNDEIARFLSRLDHAADELVVEVVGRSKATSVVGSRDLYLAVLTAKGADGPRDLDRSRPTLLLFASQHGDEQSAKEAALVLVRDLAVGDLRPLLDGVNVLVMPQMNPYGNRVDRRRNEQDLDLNRDHVKLEAPQAEAIHRVFRRWMPEVTVDAHEKGDDYYRISYGCVSNANVHESIQTYSRDVILADIAADLAAAEISFHEYLITQRMGIESAAGAALPDDAGENREWMKRFSTTDLNDGRNSLGIYETLSFILEGASRHDLKTLGERTGWQIEAMRALTKSVARHGGEIVELVANRRGELREKASTYSEDDLVHLRMEYARSESEPTLTIRRFETADSPAVGVLQQDKKAGEPVRWDDLQPFPYDADVEVVEEVVENWFPLVRPTVSVPRPAAYVVPAGHRDVVETLLRHRIEVDLFVADVESGADLPAEEYVVQHVVPAEFDYLAPEAIEVEARRAERRIEAGSFLVRTAQPAAHLIPALLEPQSQYGFIRYWKFDLVPAAGEVFPFLRLLEASEELPVVSYKRWSPGAPPN